MTDIQHNPRPRTSYSEKKDNTSADFPHDGSGDESPTRIEEGDKGATGGLLLSEEEIIARVKANPDDSTPLYLTWAPHDKTNPRNWPAWKKWQITCFASFLNFLTYVSTLEALGMMPK